jgi:hypothetical protein
MTPRNTGRTTSRCVQIVICTLIACEAGCQSASPHPNERLEAHLRDQQAVISRLNTSLAQTEIELNMARRESSILRDEFIRQRPGSEIAQTAYAVSRINRIEVVPLMSGGLDRDAVDGDELISVLVAPKDASGETHRLNGELSLRLVNFSRPAESQEVGAWNFTGNETAALWHSGVLGRGFRIVVSLPDNVLSSSIAAHVRFTTTTGDQFDVTHELLISPQPKPLRQ